MCMNVDGYVGDIVLGCCWYALCFNFSSFSGFEIFIEKVVSMLHTMETLPF